jgi:predicted Zn-dependent protease
MTSSANQPPRLPGSNGTSSNGVAGSQAGTTYRPTTRLWTKNPSYALEHAQKLAESQQGALDGVITVIGQLHKWCSSATKDETSSCRWHPKKRGSLHVYIEPSENPEWERCILFACREWEASSAGKIHFFQTVRPEKADIMIRWTAHATHGRPFEVGVTDRRIQPGSNWITQAVITLHKSPVIDQHLTAETIIQRLTTTALHEMGHALGLEHSRSSKDVMYHQGWKNKHLTQNDVQRLTTLYQADTGNSFSI